MKTKKALIILSIFLLTFSAYIFLLPNKKGLNQRYRVVIDAGHGGSDPGTIAVNGNFEKDINLEIAKKLEKKLKKDNLDTIMIRGNDSFIKVIDRANIANQSKGDVFISIHCNAVENNNKMKGLQVLYYPTEQSKELASVVHKSILLKTGAKDKGIVERKDLIVLNKSKMSAVIIETGFISNKKEAFMLSTGLYQDMIVEGIYNGIYDYLEN